MQKSKYLLLILVALTPLTSFANFDFNANCLAAYKNIFDLKLKTARQQIANEKKLRPKNAIIPLLENYIDYFYLLTTENKSDFDRLKNNKTMRLNSIEDDDNTSPYYLYAQAEINLQWALIRGRYGEYFNAALEIKKANSQLQENAKKFPGFHLNLKGLGLINAFLGNLPDGALKSTLATFGIKGNLQTGINMLDKLAENLPKSSYEPFYEETVFYYAYVLSDIAHSPSAYVKTMKYTERISDSSLLKSYLQAYVCSKTAHNEEAIKILADRPMGNAYQAFPYLDYLMAIARLNKLDLSAETYFDRFLQTNKGVNYVKDSNLHLGWIALLKGNSAGYTTYMSKVRALGFTYNERDKQALNEANSSVPDLLLLKARLLFDGGYLYKSLAVIANNKSADFKSGKDKTEFNYRLGRIYDDLGKDDEALIYYQSAISLGKNLKYYYAANAALLVGKIYENKGNPTLAKASYNTAIAIKNHEYENSIETKAKAALSHLN